MPRPSASGSDGPAPARKYSGAMVDVQERVSRAVVGALEVQPTSPEVALWARGASPTRMAAGVEA